MPAFLSPLLLLLTADPAAQQQMGFGDSVQLPTFGWQGTDHATLAVNHWGDVCVAYHARMPSGQILTEAQVIRYVGTGLWESSTADHLLLGDPTRDIYGSQRDNCAKPDVAALDDGSFCVVWPRTDKQDPLVGRLEGARILVRDVNGAFLPTLTLVTATQGEGFVLDPLAPSGDAGIMPDLCTLAGGLAAVAYVVEDSRSFGAGGVIYRDHTLRIVKLDWTAVPGQSGFLEGPSVAVSGIPLDHAPLYPLVGGLVLPDIVVDDLENLVLAWEQYWVAGHPGYAGGERGEVMVRRLEALNSASPLRVLDESVFTASATSRQQRRPSLSSTRLDTGNDVLLGWSDLKYWPFFSDKIQVRQILYPASNAAGQSLVEDRFWTNDPNWDDGYPATALTSSRQLCFGSRQFPARRQILASSHSAATMFQTPTIVQHPQRPAVEVLEATNPAGGNVSVLFISYEGANLEDPTLYRIHLGIFRI
jgi:hypothetical protein